MFVTNANSNSISVISDTSGESASPSSTAAYASPKPTVPEFSGLTLILMVAVMIVLAVVGLL